MFKSVLMVCVGNICRSPMAEGLWKERLEAKGIRVESAGLGAVVGKPAHPIAQELMRERGLDISAHRGRQLTPELVAGAELILVMNDEQRRGVEQMAPLARGRVQRIGRFGNFDVPDPMGSPREKFELALQLIQRGLSDFERAFFA
jgi:protein-tyrosine phosphatase